MSSSRKPWLLSRVYETIEGAGLIFGLVPSSVVSLRKPPTTVLEKEAYSAKLSKRRRQLKELRAGFKRFLAFLFSQIGLSILVIGYTVIGGMIFRSVELENEKVVKMKGKELRNSLADQFSGEIIRELRYQISSFDTRQANYYLPVSMRDNGLTLTSNYLKNDVQKKNQRRRSIGNCKERDFVRLRQWLQVTAYTLRQKTRQELHSSLRKLVKMMDHEGWNGEDSMDDLKWTWEGSILFAVTVITTIGYGHAVPKTNAGKVLTILYALVGIPLVFLYLTNIGDYLASLFRALYAKVCRRCCEGSCGNRMEIHTRMNVFNNQTSAVDFTQQRDFPQDESTHRNNISVIRQISSLSFRKDIANRKTKKKKVLECVDINVFCNDHVINLENHAEPESESSEKIETCSKSPNESHRVCLKGTTSPLFSCWLSHAPVTTETAKCDHQKPTNPLNALRAECEGERRPLLKETRLDSTFHTVGTQTVLQAGPNDVLTYRHLYKSFITGRYFRSYRRELLHRRKQTRRKWKLQSPRSVKGFRESGDNSCEMTWTNQDQAKIIKNMYTSLQDLQDSVSISNWADSGELGTLSVTDNGSYRSKNRKDGKSLTSYPSLPINSELQRSSSSLFFTETVKGNQCRASPPTTKYPMLKSRLSMLSSLANSSSDLMIRLSYYSDEKLQERDPISRQPSFDNNDFGGEDSSNVTVPISLSIMIMTTYILIGAIVFCIWEDPNYLKWSYFCFVTLSTIGFGDIVPGTKIDSTNPQEKLIIITVYVAVGLSVFAMCFKLMQEEVVSKCKWLARYIGVLKRKVRKQRIVRPQSLEVSSFRDDGFSNGELTFS
uniref:Ion_trans_2 domain-containing protein n=1 Tax=Mesocestoides corti TaxID=53468 RepID=A0A5K3FED7_MESCO